MTTTNTLKTFYRNNPVKSRLLLGLLVLALLPVIFRLVLSPVLVYGAESWLKKQGLEARIEDISISLSDGAFSLRHARGKKDGLPLFNVDRVEINWRWTPLAEKTIEVSKIVLKGLDLTIKQYRDEIIIGGVHMPLSSTRKNPARQAAAADERAEPWAAALGEVSFSNLNVCYLRHDTTHAQSNDASLIVDYCAGIDEMTWQGSVSYARNRTRLEKNELPIASSGNFRLNGLKVNDNQLDKYVLSSHAIALENVVITGLNDIRIKQINMRRLSALQRDDNKHRDALRFRELTVNNLHFTRPGKLGLESVMISEPGLYIVKYSPSVWEYQQWIPKTAAAKKPVSDKKGTNNSHAANSPASLDLTIGNISVTAADGCYQDNSRALYYCLTYDTMNWQGKLDYSTAAPSADAPALKARGAFSLTGILVHNHSIDRSLLKLQSFQLKDIALDGTSKATLKRAGFENLAALQRSEKDNDYTLGFDALNINDIAYYKSGIRIDNVNLDGLQALISKNGDGAWEYKKWLPDQASSQPESQDKTATEADARTAPVAEPFVISLNQLDINSDRKIAFIDNSTQPPMHIGLQKLRFDLKQLYSDKPDQDALFELFAKTSRHGTIELAGSIKPFAQKISFDAKGQLKGLDLRAASPATRKAIGHTIQSGQMDADLKLLAVDGILDSQLSLSLYQFHIKALNKKDADEVDKKFGMPLNKTLVLLRNKDGSIHLDIPITGNVNKPDFGPMDAIVKATSKAATVALITFYTPYGLAYAGGNLLFDMATDIGFDPIEFTAGSAELNENSMQQLDRLSQLLRAKPHLHLTLCGATGPRDAQALFPELKSAPAETPATPATERGREETPRAGQVLNAEQRKKLNALAGERQINSKNYLVNEKGIEHDRLILCAPQHDNDSNAVSGVEIII